jgi:hypothetical protein
MAPIPDQPDQACAWQKEHAATVDVKFVRVAVITRRYQNGARTCASENAAEMVENYKSGPEH